MSPIITLSALLFAPAVLASARAHGHAHQHLHVRGSAPYPLPSDNCTSSAWGSTGLATGASPYTSAPASTYSAAPSYSAIPSYSAAPSYSSPAQSYSAPVESSYSTWTYTSIATQYETVYQTAPVASSYASAGGYGSPSGSACAPEVTVTTTEQVYVTITPGGAPSSSESSPVESSAPAYTAPVSSSSAPAYSAPVSSSTPAYSAPAAPSYVSSSASSYSAPAAAYTPAAKQAVGTSTGSAAVSSSSSSSSSSGGKRGLAYNTAALTSCFDDSQEVSWAMNWLSASDGLPANFQYIPTLHDSSSVFTAVWDVEATAAIATGSKTLFSFNEPDESSQANMSPEAAAQAYIQYMNPYAGKAQLCAPAVTNGGGEMGLTWLQNFLSACAGNCHIDCINIHWYSPADSQGFISHVQQAISIAGTKPVWVGEFGATGASDDEVTSFLEDVMPWMDNSSSVAGYAYYMVADGQLVSGDEPSSYGSVYKSYTG